MNIISNIKYFSNILLLINIQIGYLRTLVHSKDKRWIEVRMVQVFLARECFKCHRTYY